MAYPATRQQLNWGSIGLPEDAAWALRRHPVGQRCVGAWLFNPHWQRGLAVPNLSGLGGDGSIKNTTTPYTPGWGVRLDGTNDRVEVATYSAIEAQAEFTDIVYYRPRSTVANQYVYTKQKAAADTLGRTLWYDNSFLKIWVYSDTQHAYRGILKSATPVNGWSLVAAEWANAWAVPKLFINGLEGSDESLNLTGTRNADVGPLSIGGRTYDDNRNLDCDMAYLLMVTGILPVALLRELAADPLAPFRSPAPSPSDVIAAGGGATAGRLMLLGVGGS